MFRGIAAWSVMSVVAIAFTALALDAHGGEVEPVPMRDGITLATEVLLPDGEGPFPVTLLRSVYGRGFAAEHAAPFNEKGVALVVQDTRGRGDSDGKDMVFLTDGWGELRDGADTVAWIRAQPWCNGTVTTMGGSALGITQVLMAGATQDVAAQSMLVAASDFYGQLSYQGGVWRKFLCENWVAMQGSEHVLELWKSHPSRGEFWAQFDAAARAPEITAPGLHIGGWWDIFAQGTLDNFTSRQYHGGEGARGNQLLVMGPWLHGPTREAGDLVLPGNFNYDFGGLEREFLDHWNQGVDNGVMDGPAVRYYTIGDVENPNAPGNEWREADDWPPFPTVDTPYYLAPDNTLATEAPSSTDSISYRYDPAKPCPTMGGANLFANVLPTGPKDQRELNERDDVITFMTPVLDEAVEITGRVTVVLHVSSDTPDTDFTAKLLDVYPDGRQVLMLDNIQRVKYRNGFEEPDPLTPGDIGRIEIDLWSISLIVDQGHRIGVQISSSNYPRFEKNPNTGADFPDDGDLQVATNTIHFGGETPSALVLPVRE